MITQVIKTKTGWVTLAILLLISGLLLDSSASIIAQALHHVAFIASGVAIAPVIFNRRR